MRFRTTRKFWPSGEAPLFEDVDDGGVGWFGLGAMLLEAQSRNVGFGASMRSQLLMRKRQQNGKFAIAHREPAVRLPRRVVRRSGAV